MNYLNQINSFSIDFHGTQTRTKAQIYLNFVDISSLLGQLGIDYAEHNTDQEN